MVVFWYGWIVIKLRISPLKSVDGFGDNCMVLVICGLFLGWMDGFGDECMVLVIHGCYWKWVGGLQC